MSWPLVLAAGGPRERGRMYGQQSAERIGGTLALYEQVFDHYAGLPWSEVRTLAGAFVEDIEGYDTQLLPELEGIAEGAGVEPEDLLAVNQRPQLKFGRDPPPRPRPGAATPAAAGGRRPARRPRPSAPRSHALLTVVRSSWPRTGTGSPLLAITA